MATLVLGASCEDSPTDNGGNGGNGEPPTPAFTLLQKVPAPDFPAGLALSPDNQWLAVAGFRSREVRLLEASNYQMVGSRGGLEDPLGLAFSSDSNLLVVANRSESGVVGLEIPSLEERFRVPFASVMVLHDRQRDEFYIAGRTQDVIRISTTGTQLSQFSVVEPSRIAFSRDSTSLIVYNSDQEIFILGVPDLVLVQQGRTQLVGIDRVIVPASNGLIGAVGQLGAANGPLGATLFDPSDGQSGPVDTLDSSTAILDFGGGSPWASLPTGVSLVPNSFGIVVLNSSSGNVLDLIGAEAFEGLDGMLPCCDLVLDSARSRVIFTSFPTDELFIVQQVR